MRAATRRRSCNVLPVKLYGCRPSRPMIVDRFDGPGPGPSRPPGRRRGLMADDLIAGAVAAGLLSAARRHGPVLLGRTKASIEARMNTDGSCALGGVAPALRYESRPLFVLRDGG